MGYSLQLSATTLSFYFMLYDIMLSIVTNDTKVRVSIVGFPSYAPKLSNLHSNPPTFINYA
jgi:hypothetical protein